MSITEWIKAYITSTRINRPLPELTGENHKISFARLNTGGYIPVKILTRLKSYAKTTPTAVVTHDQDKILVTHERGWLCIKIHW